MRITRTLFASAAIAAAVALSAPSANAMTVSELRTSVGDSWSEEKKGDEHGKEQKHEEHGKEHGKESYEHGKEHGKESYEHGKEHGKEHEYGKEKPHGGVHAGGGAAAMSAPQDGGYGGHGDKEGWSEEKKDHGWAEEKHHYGKEKEHGWAEEKDHYGKEKPHGGVHAGGGGLGQAGGSLTAGALLLLGGLGAGAYKLRRRNASGASVA